MHIKAPLPTFQKCQNKVCCLIWQASPWTQDNGIKGQGGAGWGSWTSQLVYKENKLAFKLPLVFPVFSAWASLLFYISRHLPGHRNLWICPCLWIQQDNKNSWALAPHLEIPSLSSFIQGKELQRVRGEVHQQPSPAWRLLGRLHKYEGDDFYLSFSGEPQVERGNQMRKGLEGNWEWGTLWF